MRWISFAIFLGCFGRLSEKLARSSNLRIPTFKSVQEQREATNVCGVSVRAWIVFLVSMM